MASRPLRVVDKAALPEDAGVHQILGLRELSEHDAALLDRVRAAGAAFIATLEAIASEAGAKPGIREMQQAQRMVKLATQHAVRFIEA